MVFKVIDYKGLSVTLSNDTWSKKLIDPIFGHPEVKPFLSQIKTAIKEPDFVYQSVRDPRSKLFFFKIKRGSFASYFLVVVVKYIKENSKTVGYVSTAMINRGLPKTSELIWERKVLT